MTNKELFEALFLLEKEKVTREEFEREKNDAKVEKGTLR